MSMTTGLELLDPNYYGANGPPYEIWRELRAKSPIHWLSEVNASLPVDVQVIAVGMMDRSRGRRTPS